MTPKLARITSNAALLLAIIGVLVLGSVDAMSRADAGPPVSRAPVTADAGAMSGVTPAVANASPAAAPDAGASAPATSPAQSHRPAGGAPLVASFDSNHVVHSINIGEYGCGDPFNSNAQLQHIVSSHGIPYIRAPFRDGCSDAAYLDMLHAIVGVGAVPQVTIHGNCTLDTRYQSVSDHFLSLVDSATGSEIYWVEYGNEEDIGCSPAITSTDYVTGWNRDIPSLHTNHPRARFIGPVTAGHNTGWINLLLSTGVPHPDAISWHWYPCGLDTLQSSCMTHTADIDNDINQTDAEEATVHVPAPIWITEWDMGFNQDQTTFLKQCFTDAIPSCVEDWLALAIEHLRHLHDTANLAAAEFYVLTNGNPNSQTQLCYPPPSVSFTPVGAAFFGALALTREVSGSTPPASIPPRGPVNQSSPPPTPPPSR